MTTLAKAALIVNYRPILSSERVLRKDYESKYSVEKKKEIVSLKGLAPRRIDWR
jgi:hypothetical protein